MKAKKPSSMDDFITGAKADKHIRKPKAKTKVKHYTVRKEIWMSEDMAKTLTNHSTKKHISEAHIVREALTEYLDNYGKAT